MSKLLDEASIAKKVFDKITGYGRLATFTVKGTPNVDHEWYITPPRATDELRANENTQAEIRVFLVAALDIPFTPYRTMKVVDGKTSYEYRITNIDPIDSGDITQAYKIRASR